MLCVNAFSQISENPEADEKKIKNEAILAKMKDLPEPSPVVPNPSRYAGEDLEQYIIKRAAVFSMRNREMDPFLLGQDPNAKPIEKKIATNTLGRGAALPPTPLAEIINLIRVTTIMPRERKFLVGVREFKESDEFPLEYQGKTMRVKVVKVTARKIVFRDLAKGEEAVLETRILPPGMVAGDDKLQPPGMISPDSNQPLQIGLGEGLVNPNN